MAVGMRQRLWRVSGARSPELKNKQTRPAATTSLDRKVSRSFATLRMIHIRCYHPRRRVTQ
jgi:hypothetical protein